MYTIGRYPASIFNSFLKHSFLKPAFIRQVKCELLFTLLLLLPAMLISATNRFPTANDTAFLTLNGPNIVCEGQTTAFSVDFTSGNAPFVFTPEINGIAQTPVVSNTTPAAFSLPVPAGINIVTIGNASANGVPVTASGSVNVTGKPKPTATLTGGGDLCFNGPGDSLTVTFTGSGPFTFVYSIGGIAQSPITTSKNIYKIFINPVMYTKYQLVSVTAQGCPGMVSGMAEIFVYVSSNASLSSNLTFCGGVNTTLEVNLTGTAPFTLTYSVNGQVQPPITAQEGPIPITANITQTTVYKLISIESPGCLQPETDSQVIFINYTPTYSNVAFNCNLITGLYTVTFDVIGGTPPYTLLSGSGSFLGDQFVSQPIPVANNYNFSFHDAANCGNVTVSGQNTCNCTTKAGTVNTTPLELCEGDAATTIHNQNQVLDGNDALRYILHTLPSFPAGQIIAWSNTPSFPFTGAVQPEVTYYISAIAGDDAGNGQVNMNDICLSVSPGRPVIWHTKPTAALAADVDICAGNDFQLPVQFTGAPAYSLSYTIGSQLFTENGVQPPFSITAPASNNTAVILTSVSDQHCTTSLSDTALVNVYEPPVAGLPVVTCDYATETYTVGFSILKGDLPSVSISGLTGNYNAQTGQFLSDPIPSTDPFQATILDKWMCGTDTVSGISDCLCTTDAGILGGDTLRLCFGFPVNLLPVTGSNLESSDTLIYVLTTSTNPALWTILARNATPDFVFPAGQVISGTVYYVMGVAGEKSAGGINLSDPCLSVSNAIPVIWRNIVTAAVSGNSTICEGQSASILVQLAGGSGYSFDLYANNTLYQAIANTNSTLSFYNVFPTVTTVYTVKNLTAGGCAGTGVTSATVTVNPLPKIVGLQQICDADNLHYTLQFGISDGPAPNTTYSVTGITGVFLTDTVFVSDAYPAATPYSITVTTPAGCTFTIGGSGACGCATDAGTIMPLVPDACTSGMVSAMFNNDATLDPNDILYYFICDDPGAIPQSILATSSTPSFGFLPGMSIETIYYIFAAAGNALPDGTIDFSDPCTGLSGGVTVQFHDAPSVVMEPLDTAICKGQGFQIPLSLTGAPPFKLTYKLNGDILPEITTNLPAFVISTSNIQDDQVFELIAVSDANCTGIAAGTAIIRVKEQPVLTFSGSTSVCPGQAATLTLQLDNATSASVEILSSNGPAIVFSDVAGTYTFSIPQTVTTTYTIGTVVFTGNDCPGLIQGSVKVTISPVYAEVTISDHNGFGVSCNGATDGSVALQPFGGNGQYNFLWSTGGIGNALVGVKAGNYEFTVSDLSGCQGTGQVTITEPAPLVFDVSSVSPLCTDNDNGSLILETVTGGVAPYNMEFEHKTGVPVNSLPQTISGLSAGDYHLQITDANGCTNEATEFVDDPLPLSVSLGDDQTIILGDSVWLTAAALNPDIQHYTWSQGVVHQPLDSSSVLVIPVKSITYQVTVTNSTGCTATDDILISVKREDSVYIPNIIAPQAGGTNAVMTVYAGREVTHVNYLRVYDRWGELLFENNDFLPNDPSQGWNGFSKNKKAEPGVYFYVLEVEKYGGVKELVKGDVTVAR